MNKEPNNDKLDRLESLLGEIKRTMFSNNAKHLHIIPSATMSLVKTLADHYSNNTHPLTISDLAADSKLSLSATSQHISTIEEKMGLVKRRLNRDDKRVIEIIPTKRGRIMFAHMNKHRRHSQVLCELLDYLGPRDSDELLRLLERINQFNSSTDKKSNSQHFIVG